MKKKTIEKSIVCVCVLTARCCGQLLSGDRTPLWEQCELCDLWLSKDVRSESVDWDNLLCSSSLLVKETVSRAEECTSLYRPWAIIWPWGRHKNVHGQTKNNQREVWSYSRAGADKVSWSQAKMRFKMWQEGSVLVSGPQVFVFPGLL